MDWMQAVLSLVAGLATAIPLAIKLVEYVKASIKEKNWTKVLALVTSYMERAESMFETGADRKEWVLAMVKASADSIDYDVDMDTVGELIDSLTGLSKVVNATTEA